MAERSHSILGMDPNFGIFSGTLVFGTSPKIMGQAQNIGSLYKAVGPKIWGQWTPKYEA